MPLEEILQHYEIHTPELFEFLQAMLRIRPQDRRSARELLSYKWLNMEIPYSAAPEASNPSPGAEDASSSDGEVGDKGAREVATECADEDAERGDAFDLAEKGGVDV